MPELPPGQQLAASGKWPHVGEKTPRASNEPWSVAVGGLVDRPSSWTLEDFARLSQVERTIDIHCVTRWSMPGARFRGVLLETLLELAGPRSDARFVSFIARSERNHSTSLPLGEAIGLGTLVATHWNDQPLTTDHGGPVRTVVPERYFYKSLKWLERIELLAEDRLGFWEASAGYHNVADPWREQRYIVADVDPRQVRAILASRNVAGRELLGLDGTGLDLEGFAAERAVLRNARLERARLAGADFRGANLSNAHFGGADLTHADFRGADCEGADFAGADLTDADFRGASLFGATFLTPTGTEPQRAARLSPGTQFDEISLRALEVTPDQIEFVRRRGR